jgi:hypothetical protein
MVECCIEERDAFETWSISRLLHIGWAAGTLSLDSFIILSPFL